MAVARAGCDARVSGAILGRLTVMLERGWRATVVRPALGIVRCVAETESGRLKILVSAGTMGGPGGAQRALSSILRACADDEVDVVARKVVQSSDERSTAKHVWGREHWRWAGSKSTVGLKGTIASTLNPIRAALFPRYDVHIRLYQGVEVNAALRAGVRLLVPSGNPVDAAVARAYDFVAMQAPDNARLVPEGVPTTLLPPPLYALNDHSEPPSAVLPDNFHLTVFNPYGPIKGVDDLERAVEESPLPIVWCHSDRGVANHVPPALREHPRIVHVLDPTQSELRWLYERCVAYLCFSKSEGFGWSIADGLRHSGMVVSRDVGILTHPAARRLPGVIRTDEEWRLDWSLLPTKRQAAPERDLSFQSPDAFRASLVALTRPSR